jgi:outer membrane PBP1 activator LpoA protein
MRTTFLLFFLTALLVACGVQPEKPLPTENTETAVAERIQQLLKQAQGSASPKREQLQLKAAALLLQEGQRELVDNILHSMLPEELSLHNYARYIEVSSKLAISRGNYQQASSMLDSDRLLQQFDNLSQDKQLRLSLLRAEVFALLGSHIASAQQRIYINPLLDLDNQASNREAIWASLMQVTQAELKHYLSSSFTGEYQGWLLLALIAKENQGDLEQQVRQLDNWQLQWPQHPANLELPGGLQLIKQLAENRPQQLALMLPLTGKLAPFGKAVRDGFIAALYDTKGRGSQIPKLKVYNTDASEDFIALYQQAVDEGAEMVIGPLEKHRLSLLFDQLSLPVPTLGLNQLDNYGQSPEQLYQFGLVPQDEAKQIADIAYLDNHRQAYIITPEGEWGDKVSDAFIQRWQALGGTTIALSRYSGQKDYSSSIKQSLLLQDSEDRAKRIETLIGERLEFSPRRREDVDMVFLLANPQQARSIKPLLAYHYAADLPVYGTSRLYAGYQDTSRDRDLNGVRFTDMPWILQKPTAVHQQINEQFQLNTPYQRMYALGVDSYQLHPRLRQLAEIPTSRVYGNTGNLKLNQRNEIEREMLLAQIVASKAKLIPIASQSINLNLPTMDGADDDRTMDTLDQQQ